MRYILTDHDHKLSDDIIKLVNKSKFILVTQVKDISSDNDFISIKLDNDHFLVSKDNIYFRNKIKKINNIFKDIYNEHINPNDYKL